MQVFMHFLTSGCQPQKLKGVLQKEVMQSTSEKIQHKETKSVI